jgi:hypothetical protein
LDTLAMTQTGTAIMGDTLNHDDYDSPWKEVLERYFPAFLAFFFPDRPRRHRLDARLSLPGQGTAKGRA